MKKKTPVVNVSHNFNFNFNSTAVLEQRGEDLVVIIKDKKCINHKSDINEIHSLRTSLL